MFLAVHGQLMGQTELEYSYGDDIKMWLPSQGSWVKVIGTENFSNEIYKTIAEMFSQF